MKTGILLATSAMNDLDGALLINIRRHVVRRFAGVEARWAVTHVSRGAPREDGKRLELPEEALLRMSREGFTQVAVQPLHVVGGSEYEIVREAVTAFQRGPDRFEVCAIGEPLLNGYADLMRVAKAVLARAAEGRTRDDALILIGHGSEGHAADLAYMGAAWALNSQDRLAFLGCVNGPPAMADIVSRCVETGVRRAFLAPFTTVAGSTVRDALAEDGPRSWLAALRSENIDGVAVMKGLGEYDEVAEVWLDHAETALGRLSGGAEHA